MKPQGARASVEPENRLAVAAFVPDQLRAVGRQENPRSYTGADDLIDKRQQRCKEQSWTRTYR